MHNQLPVGEFHSSAYLEEDLKTPANEQAPRIAIGIDGLSHHQFHDEKGQSVIANAPIEKGCDVGMPQLGKNLAFAPEPLVENRRPDGRGDGLDGDRQVDLAILARGPIYRAHPTAADQFSRPICAEARQRLCGGSRGLLYQQVPFEELADVPHEIRGAPTRYLQERFSSLPGRKVYRLPKDAVQPGEVLLRSTAHIVERRELFEECVTVKDEGVGATTPGRNGCRGRCWMATRREARRIPRPYIPESSGARRPWLSAN